MIKTVFHWDQIGKAFAGLLAVALLTWPLGLPLWAGCAIGVVYALWADIVFDLYHFEW